MRALLILGISGPNHPPGSAQKGTDPLIFFPGFGWGGVRVQNRSLLPLVAAAAAACELLGVEVWRPK